MNYIEYTVVGCTDVLEEDEEDSESEPEGQDIDELYHFVKQTHQQETQSIQVDVQHPALIPVLRPYQREAVNWMLQQEHFRSAPASGKYKMLQEKQTDWREYMRRELLLGVGEGELIIKQITLKR